MELTPCEDRPRGQGPWGMRFGVDVERAASLGSTGHDRPTPLFWAQAAVGSGKPVTGLRRWEGGH